MTCQQRESELVAGGHVEDDLSQRIGKPENRNGETQILPGPFQQALTSRRNPRAARPADRALGNDRGCGVGHGPIDVESVSRPLTDRQLELRTEAIAVHARIRARAEASPTSSSWVVNMLTDADSAGACRSHDVDTPSTTTSA